MVTEDRKWKHSTQTHKKLANFRNTEYGIFYYVNPTSKIRLFKESRILLVLITVLHWSTGLT